MPHGRPDAGRRSAAHGLRAALDAGAFSDADHAGRTLLARLQRGEAATEDVLHALLDWLMTTGQRETAVALAAGHPALRTASDALASLGTLLDARTAPAFTLPSGRLNLLAVAHAEANGALTPDDVARLLRRHPQTLRDWPHASLLLWNAARAAAPGVAVAALNRFLAGQGQGPATLTAGDALPLARLHLAAPAPSGGPLVSVIMAARDAAATVGYALRSLLGQSHSAIEVLCCDDASRDGTLDAILASRHDPRLRVFRSAAPQGPYNVRNALLSRTRGEWIGFHDADDLAMPDRIARQLRRLRRRGAVVAVGQTLRMRPDGRIVFYANQQVQRLGLFSTLYKRRVVDTLGPFFPARVGADLDYFERARETFGESAVVRCPEVLFLGLWSDASLTRQPGLESLEDGFRAPLRRDYCQWLFERRTGRKTPAEVAAALVASGNVAAPAPIVSLWPRERLG